MSKITRRNALARGGQGDMTGGFALVPDHPDKRLFQLFKAFLLELASIRAQAAATQSQPDAVFNAERFWDVSNEILALPAETVDGVATKIRVAIVSFVAMCECAGIEMADDALPLKMLNGVADDAERLAGRAI